MADDNEKHGRSRFWLWFFLAWATCDICFDRWQARAMRARIAELDERISQVVPRDAGTPAEEVKR